MWKIFAFAHAINDQPSLLDGLPLHAKNRASHVLVLQPAIAVVIVYKRPIRGALEEYGIPFLAATKQLYEWFSPSVCPSVRLSVIPF